MEKEVYVYKIVSGTRLVYDLVDFSEIVILQLLSSMFFTFSR